MVSFRVIGYCNHVKGIAQNMRMITLALRHIGAEVLEVPVNERVPIHNPDAGGGTTYDIDLFCYHESHPSQRALTLSPAKKRAMLVAWELEVVPQELVDLCRREYGHIFSVSRFTARALAAAGVQSTVLHIPPPPPQNTMVIVPTTRFTVLFVFDFASSMYRKNPQDAITAFMLALRDCKDTVFRLKTMNANDFPHEKQALEGFIRPYRDRVMWDDSVYTEDQMTTLYQSCDVYMSLHRSEGYGLTILYAMAMGKPVITTGYSGNLDFCNSTNAMLVRVLRKVPVTEQDTVYSGVANATWAQPDIMHAAACLRLLWEDPAQRLALGERGKRHPRLSLDTLGKALLEGCI